jgi:hypothetical protein
MIAMHSRPDVAACDAVDRSSVNVKITGNMIELKRPTAIAAYAGDFAVALRGRETQECSDESESRQQS